MLTTQHYRAAMAFLERLYAQRDADAFPHFLVREVPELIGADHTSWDDVALTVPRAEIVEAPRLPDLQRRTEAFRNGMLTHPCIRYWMRTGDMRPLKLSDFVSTRELHRLPIYNDLFHPMGYEDQIGVMLTPVQPTSRAIALGRDRRSFTEDDRELLALIRPHLAQAYRNAQDLSRARNALTAEEEHQQSLGMCLVDLDGAGRPHQLSSLAARWLRRYFNHRRSRELPPALRDWLGACTAQHASTGPLPSNATIAGSSCAICPSRVRTGVTVPSCSRNAWPALPLPACSGRG